MSLNVVFINYNCELLKFQLRKHVCNLLRIIGKERHVKIRNRSFMAIVLDDILNPEFTTNSMRWIPVSVKVARVDILVGIPPKFA